MVFSSITFLVGFLPLFILFYQWVGKKYKNAYLLFTSILFYSWGAPQFIFVILLTTVIDFFLVRKMDAMETMMGRKALLALSLSINIGLLVYFKYANFFIENINAVTGYFGIAPIIWVKLLLPIGISFYTFETITYVIDVYRKVHKPLRNFWDYQLYIILFPKLIAGPIVRFHSIADQITDRNETIDDKLHGFIRFCIGLGKKILIANVLGEQANAIMDMPSHNISSSMLWIGILSYTFQIYFDFSGYSDMALGLAKMVGFTIPENFDNPYNAKSISEFWRRWHISLGQWMKNYLYIPLGGNRSNTQYKVLFNLIFVFFISGLWHGASWNFVIWGMFHGFFLILDRLFLLKLLDKLGTFFSVIFTFLAVAIGWVFFRIEGFQEAIHYIIRLFDLKQGTTPIAMQPQFIFIFIMAIIFSFSNLFSLGRKMQQLMYVGNNTNKWYISILSVSIMILILALSNITTEGFNPFIYFRF
ncbi:MAG: MBOAT family protein [Bacteroidia bacterium]|nr:MBOAT family protein [Bacteroidia bacterium]